MNEEQNNQEIPSFEAEEMKMPENTTGEMSEPTTTEKNVVSGPVLALLAFILILILGGMYYWFTVLSVTEPTPAPINTERPTAEENNEPESTTAEAQTNTMLVTSPSDEIEAIEADVESTDLDSLDAEMQAIDAEIEAAIQE